MAKRALCLEGGGCQTVGGLPASAFLRAGTAVQRSMRLQLRGSGSYAIRVSVDVNELGPVLWIRHLQSGAFPTAHGCSGPLVLFAPDSSLFDYEAPRLGKAPVAVPV